MVTYFQFLPRTSYVLDIVMKYKVTSLDQVEYYLATCSHISKV